MYIYALIETNVLEAIFAAGEQLSIEDQDWVASLLQALQNPFEGSNEEAKTRLLSIVNHVVPELETKKSQQPYLARQWDVLTRMAMYLGAMARQDLSLKAEFEKRFTDDLRFFQSQAQTN